MEQTNFLPPSPSEEWVFDILLPHLLCTVKNNNANPDSLVCKKGKNYSSVWFSKQLAFRICLRDNQNYFGVSADLSAIASPEISATLTSVGKANGFHNYEFTPTEEGICYFSEFLKGVLDQAIDSIPKEFDCCSRYVECSNAQKCTHPSPDFAVTCGYRKILKSGRIYYGDNKNI